jgi:hypothetical protein
MNEYFAASISFNGGFYKITTMSNGGLSFVDWDEPAQYLRFNSASELLGEGVRRAVLASKKIPPAELKGILNAAKEKAEERIEWEIREFGYKSKAALFERWIICSVQVSDEFLKIFPRHRDSLNGYKGISIDGPEILRLPLNGSDAELGDAVKEALRRCTAAPEFELPVVP